MSRTRKFLSILICAWAISTGLMVHAQEADCQNTVLEVEGFQRKANITDGNRETYSKCEETAEVTLSHEHGIAAIYIEFDRLPQEWTLTNPASGVSVTCGKNMFLHEYVNVTEVFGEMPDTLIMKFPEGTSVTDIYGFSQGELPEWVQRWEPPCEKADLLLISSHSDDEQLFFAGILPYYAVERKLNVQVAYAVQHFEANGVFNHQRPHEQLDGLWKVGIRNYPILSEFPDLYAESKDRETALKQAIAVFEGAGFSYDDFVGYLTECLRRCKPLVVVSHDLDGEYGHGTHVLCAKALTEAIEYAADETAFPESAETYGAWTVEKTYLHLYEENPIVMDFDTPLESLGGKSAFQVSQEGFGCHKSQHWTWFYKWMYGTADRPIKKASDITRYSPCQYGLYDSKVGADTVGGDFLENIQTYKEREAEEKRLALEAEKKAAEEATKRAEEAALKAAKEAAEKEQKEKEALEQQALAEMEAAKQHLMMTVGVGLVLLVVVIGVISAIVVKKRRR